jgi:hypothetical protein
MPRKVALPCEPLFIRPKIATQAKPRYGTLATYHDNIIIFYSRVISSHVHLWGRIFSTELTTKQFADMLSPELAKNLRNELIRQYPIQENNT